MGKWYAVKVGRVPGIYSSWQDCSKQTSGHSGSVFKSFTSREDALLYYYDGNIPSHEKVNGPILLSRAIELPTTRVFPSNSSDSSSPPISYLQLVRDPNNFEALEPYSYRKFIPPRISNKAYLQADRNILNTKGFLVIYIDGSKRKSINHRGSGAYCRFQQLDFALSVPYCNEIAQKYHFNEIESQALSSPTMEYLAFSEVLLRLVQIQLPSVDGVLQILNPRLRIIFVVDYIGVKCFTEGSWTAKKSYIIKIKTVCLAAIEYLKERGIDIIIEHCDGHVGVLGNELSDLMAKNPSFYDTFGILAQALSDSFKRSMFI